MIAINPLYLLFLVELICLLAGGATYYFLKKRSLWKLYLSALKELSAAKQIEEELKKQMAAFKSEAGQKKQAQASHAQKETNIQTDQRLDELKKQLLDAQTALKDKTEKMEQLQVKFSDLEKEYMILYHQQQKQQG